MINPRYWLNLGLQNLNFQMIQFNACNIFILWIYSYVSIGHTIYCSILNMYSKYKWYSIENIWYVCSYLRKKSLLIWIIVYSTKVCKHVNTKVLVHGIIFLWHSMWSSYEGSGVCIVYSKTSLRCVKRSLLPKFLQQPISSTCFEVDTK